jgi:hypothetical protein
MMLKFDIQHRLLRHEKFDIDVKVKTGEIRCNTLEEEFLILSKSQVSGR